MKEYREYDIDVTRTADFHNHVDFCLGTGRIGLALHSEYHDQLTLIQEEISF